MFSRLMPAMVTPLDEGGGVDLGAAEAVVERFVEAGVSGISPLGSTGEAPVSFRTSPAKSASASPRG